MMKKQLLLFVVMVLPLMASAYDIEVENDDGVTIYYNYINDGRELAVTFKGDTYDSYKDEYWGNVKIPSEVTYLTRTRKVTRIGESAFDGCLNLTYIAIPNSVANIGDYAFRNCSGLTSVSIPNSVTSIGLGAFYRCYDLTSVSLGNGLKSIGRSTFYKCENIKKVIVHDIAAWCNITFDGENSNPLYFGHHLYSDENTEIKDLVIPNSVTSITNCAFAGCSALTSITIPNSVTSIGDRVLRKCTGITSITIPNSVTTIGDYAFSHCSELNSIAIGNSVSSIGEDAFYYCYNLKKVIVSDIAAWCEINFKTGFYESNPLSIAHHLYSDENTEIKNLVIPNSVTNIDALRECYNFISIKVDNNNPVYDSRDNCNAIIETSTNTLLLGCMNTFIPTTVTSIGDGAFYGCSTLTSITIPNSVTSIGSSAFSGCSGLTSITIPNSVTSIGSGTFYECSGLTSVTIGNSVTSIGNSVFSGCSGLTSVTIGNSVTSIGYRAFEGCSSLTSVTIPNSVTSIGWDAFSNCSGLTSVTIPNSVTSIGENAFNQCSGLTSVTIPNSVTSIGSGAFYRCSGLTSITIPNSVTSIGSQAFDGVDLTTVVSLIENLFTIFGKSSSSFRAFSENTFNNATLYVPVGTIDKYKATNGWKDFAHIVEGDPTGIKNIETEQLEEVSYYGLDGKRIESPKSGSVVIKKAGQKAIKVVVK